MSSTVELSWLTPLASALMMWAVGLFVLVRYFKNGLRESLLWGFALVSYGSSHMMEFAFMYNLLTLDSLTYFIRQTFVSIMLVLFYGGCSIILARHGAFAPVSTALFFAIQEPPLFYCDFIIGDFTLSSTLHILLFVIPFSIFFVSFFLVYYFSSKRTGPLLLAAAWLAYAVIVPFYFLWRETPLFPVWFVLRSVTLVPLLIGFALLAYRGTRRTG